MSKLGTVWPVQLKLKVKLYVCGGLKWALEKQGVNVVSWTELAQVESNAGCCDYNNIPFTYTEEFPDQ
jgi:hypothetical protein